MLACGPCALTGILIVQNSCNSPKETVDIALPSHISIPRSPCMWSYWILWEMNSATKVSCLYRDEINFTLPAWNNAYNRVFRCHWDCLFFFQFSDNIVVNWGAILLKLTFHALSSSFPVERKFDYHPYGKSLLEWHTQAWQDLKTNKCTWNLMNLDSYLKIMQFHMHGVWVG